MAFNINDIVIVNNVAIFLLMLLLFTVMMMVLILFGSRLIRNYLFELSVFLNFDLLLFGVQVIVFAVSSKARLVFIILRLPIFFQLPVPTIPKFLKKYIV